jgi:hypothetical protein
VVAYGGVAGGGGQDRAGRAGGGLGNRNPKN